MEFYLSQHRDGPQACLDGELALHADLALSDLIAEVILSLPPVELRLNLELFRLVYWQTFNEHTNCWATDSEREAIAYEIALRQLASEVDPYVLVTVANIAQQDVSQSFRGWSESAG